MSTDDVRERASVGTPGGDSRLSYLLPAGSERTPTLSVVMPTLNEETGIATCIRQVERALDELGVYGEVIVSDSSTDRTPEIARDLGAIVVKPDGRGYGYAYQYAFRHARGEYIAMGDADTTYNFEELPKLYELVAEDGADIALGSRLDGEIRPGAMPSLHRYVGNPLLTKFLNTFYGTDVSDTHSGFRVLTRDALERLNLQSTGMEFASEMIMDAGTKGLRIIEAPITYHERRGEAKLDSFNDGWRHVKFMLINAPSYLFSGPGMVLGCLGMVIIGLSLASVSLADIDFGIHTAIVGSLFTIVGYQIGCLAVFSSVAADPIKNPQDLITTWVSDHFRLEYGVTFGLGLLTVGCLYGASFVYRWVASGYVALPVVQTHLFAFTLVVLGIQTVFHSFFLSVLIQHPRTR